MRILFICKYNRFRSKVAEYYFNKINKNKKIIVQSAGIIEVDEPLLGFERRRNQYILEKFGFNINDKSCGIKVSLLEKQDKIIVVANDIPLSIFNSRFWKDKVEIWKIKDEERDNVKNINKIVNQIIVRINKLNKDLN